MIDSLVLFLTYQWSPLAQHHWSSLLRSNSGLHHVVVAWAGNLRTEIPHISVSKPDYATGAHDWEWANSDKLFTGALAQNPHLQAKRYIIIEYDCEVTAPLETVLHEAWNTDVGCSHYFTRAQRPDWPHWGRVPSYQWTKSKPEEYGVCYPLNGLVMSAVAMNAFLEFKNVRDFSEARVGTFATRTNIRLVSYDPTLQFNHWDPNKLALKEYGIRHPVKEIRHFES